MTEFNMSTITKYLFFALVTFTLSCKTDTADSSKETTTVKSDNFYDQLIGVWEMETDEESKGRKFRENWEKVSDQLFVGSAYLINIDADTRFNTELLRLAFEDNSWILYAQLPKKEEVPFAATILTNTVMRFENPEHIFPKYIQYTFLEKERISIEIGDKSKIKTWEMTRFTSPVQ